MNDKVISMIQEYCCYRVSYQTRDSNSLDCCLYFEPYTKEMCPHGKQPFRPFRMMFNKDGIRRLTNYLTAAQFEMMPEVDKDDTWTMRPSADIIKFEPKE